MNPKRLLVPLGMAIVLMALLGWGIGTATADAPSVIPYQGRLTDASGQPVQATLPMTFALYAVPQGGSADWIEAHPAITVTDGLFTAYLGDIVPLSAQVLNGNAYLGLTVGSDSEMTPRQRLGSVPYARTLAAGATISGAAGPLVSVVNTLDAFRPGNGTALALHGTTGSGPVLSVRLDSADGPPAAFASAIYARRDSGIGAWATIQSTNYSDWPGLAANSTSGTALVGISGDPGTSGSPAGGPFFGWAGTLLPAAKAGVLGYSSVGPGVFAWSSITHSLVVSGSAHVTGELLAGRASIEGSSASSLLVVSNTLVAPEAPGIQSYGNPGVQGWSTAGAPGVAGHNDTASGVGVLGTSLNHSAVAGYAGIAGGQPGSATALALQKAGVAGFSTIGPGGYFSATNTGLYATGINGPAIVAYKGGPMDGYGFDHTIVASGGLVPGLSAVVGTSWSGPGMYGLSQEGSGVLGQGGRSTGGPVEEPLKSVSANTGAGVMGYSTVGPGVFAWSTITHSLVVSGSARVTGDLLVSGDVITNADVAEYYVAVGMLEAGDVVVLDASTDLGVRRADQPYDTRVAGVISTDPAIILPGAVDGVPLALVGRVPVKTDASFGAIRVGDLLTTSPTPGHAMRCGDRLQCVGAIIGKALEPLDSGSGVILVLVTLQ